MSLHNSQESQSNFNIQDYIEYLTPSPKKEKNKYICPVCSGHNLSIAKNSPKYDCYNCGDTNGIAKTLLAEYAPKKEKKIRPQQYREWIYTDREGNPLVKVCRIDDGLGKRKIWQQRYENNQWINGLDNLSKERIPIFNYQKIKQKIKAGEIIFLVEGEPCCDALNELGLIATTNLGGSDEWNITHTQNLIEIISNVQNLEQKNVNYELINSSNNNSNNSLNQKQTTLNNDEVANSQNHVNNDFVISKTQEEVNSNNSNLEANKNSSNNNLLNSLNQQETSLNNDEVGNGQNHVNNDSAIPKNDEGVNSNNYNLEGNKENNNFTQEKTDNIYFNSVDDNIQQHGDNNNNFDEKRLKISIVLSPDRDVKGIRHMEKIYHDFPSAQWLYPNPQSPLWNIKIPESQGLDMVDWIEEMKAQKFTNQQIRSIIIDSLEDKPRNLKLEVISDSKVINHPLFHPITCQELKEKIEDLCHDNLSQVDVELEINRIATEFNRIPSEIRRIYHAIRRENEQDEQVNELLETLPDIIKIPNTDLDLYKILPPDLAASICELAEAMPTAPEALFTALLPTWACAIGQKSRIIAKVSSGYTQPAILRTAIVAYSGERKSPALKSATKALQIMEENAYQKYRQELADYEQLLDIYDPKSGEPKPKKPQRKRYMVTDINFEGLIAVAKDNPSLLNVVDELAGYFKRMNKFSHGKGDDIERDLSLFNGGSLMKDRATEQIFIENTTISAVGTIQWEKLKELQQGYGEEDPAGILSRWLFCAKKLPAGYLDLLNDSEQQPSLDFYNEVIIATLQSLPKTDYILSLSGKRIFQEWQHQLVNQMRSQPIEAMRVAYPKFESYCLRLTLIFHCLWGIYDETATSVSGETVQKAIYATNWFITQYRYILAKNAQSNNIEGNALRLLTLLERKQELTIGQARKYDRTLYQLKETDLKILFEALCSASVAEKIPNSKTLKIKLSA
ncbi:DUF3987 domain-containing protein [Cyanobacterium aponinum]|uniref:DUF3987 domain-containing protein n=1 Tax=Cyanobacterium aponinum 0216 TaxID=2676140 RepID=A0A844GZX4_9CHRO|nr:DUF3987 domain-containing protein [Cyanobacterium aponinum]MTF40339.1 DUF3987 domain-containing protein [Cyanobacterium aponinum 0216]